MKADRIVLIGFSGTGKSTIAALVARALDWHVVDVDQEIEAQAGKHIPEIFAEDGEAEFRSIERETLRRALRRNRVVVATGGGAVASEDVWGAETLKSPGTLTIALDAAPYVILSRLQSQVQRSNETIERPMLAGNDPLGRVAQLKLERQAFYDRADLTLIVDNVPADVVAAEVAGVAQPSDEHDLNFRVPGGGSRIVIQPGTLARLGTLVRQRWATARKAWLITDDRVGPLHASRAAESLASAGLGTQVVTVPAGESSKSWERAGDLVGRMLTGGIQRNDVVIALGGGVIGDLAGFAAAVVLRGVGLVQVPTSLLAMVDSSVGGKTAVNHASGKNLRRTPQAGRLCHLPVSILG